MTVSQVQLATLLDFLKHAGKTVAEETPKLPELFRQTVSIAAGLPVEIGDSYYIPSEKSKVKAAFNLAGLAQTGAIPFAPRGAGILGSSPVFGDPKRLKALDLAKSRANDYFDILNSTPKQRAKELLGFDTENPLYHYSATEKPFDRFKDQTHLVDLGKDYSGIGADLFEYIGTHTGTKKAAAQRYTSRAGFEGLDPADIIKNGFGSGLSEIPGQTLPLYGKLERQLLDNTGKPMSEAALSHKLGTDFMEFAHQTKQPYLVGKKQWAPEALDAYKEHLWSKYDALPYINNVEDIGSISYILPPQNLRSINAAFDPLKSNSTNIMAGLGPLFATGLGAYLLTKKEKQ